MDLTKEVSNHIFSSLRLVGYSILIYYFHKLIRVIIMFRTMNIKSIGLITLFLIPILVFGQFKSPEEIEKLYWTTEAFSMPDYPEKWKTESAIILSQNESLKYDRFRSDKNVITALRRQILL